MGCGNAILIVDDNEVNREMLLEILHDEYHVIQAEDGQDALEVLRERGEEIEGIVLDLIMPRMDGYEFLSRFSREEKWKNLPVIVATADDSAEVENKCLKLGAWDFVRKPYNPATVLLRLQSVVSRRRLHIMEQQRITNLFQKYVEPSVLDELLKSDVSDGGLHGKTEEIAVLFADIRDFTGLSEKIEPEKVVDVLDEFLTLTSGAIMRNGGTLDKFIGDCSMAFWGAPLPCEDKAYKACLAATEMMEEAKGMEENLRRKFGRTVTFGVGIHLGPAVVGSVGSPDRKDYTAVGDTVNTASRLESAAPAGEIYISRSVADSLGERGRCTSLGSNIPLKGKSEGFEILTLDRLSRTDGRSPWIASPSGWAAPTAGGGQNGKIPQQMWRYLSEIENVVRQLREDPAPDNAKELKTLRCRIERLYRLAHPSSSTQEITRL